MNTKLPSSRFDKTRNQKAASFESWHNGADMEIHLYGKALRSTAKNLLRKLESEASTQAQWDVCPIILLYRQAMELHLKAVVSEGSGFLKVKVDPITLFTTHSTRWLAQIVRQIVKAVGWERQFVCDGVTNLTAFSTKVAQIDALDPVPHLIYSRSKVSTAPNFQVMRNVQFTNEIDALLDLLDSTADGLAATWALRVDTLEPPDVWSDVDTSTIH